MAQGVKHYFDLTNSQYGITLRVHYSQTYEIETNESSVAITKVQVKSSTNKGFLRYLDGSITIGGTTAVSMSSYHGTHSIYVGDLNTFYDVNGSMGSVSGITHNNDGSKSVTISVTIDSFRDSGKADWSVSGSKSIVLTTIPRASSLSVSNGTLGVAQTIKVTRKSTSFSHTITYTCGSASGTICTKSQEESFEFTPHIELASQNTTGTSVTVKFTLQTYSGTTAIGSAVSATVAMAIPASIKPGCSLTVTDATGYFATFGGYVQGQSKLSVSIGGTKAYGSEIASYKATANGSSYTKQSFVTELLTDYGEQTVSATVTDKRGRTSETATETITVLAYSLPRITALSVHRCNEDGTENSIGSFAKVTYSHIITSLGELNDKKVTLKYKKSANYAYTSVELEAEYISENATYIFSADDGSSYDIMLVVEDSFTGSTPSSRGTSVSTADVILHFRADGKGMGAGKVSEKANALDMGWDIELNGHNLLKNGDPLKAEDVGAAPAGYGLGVTVKDITVSDLDSTTSNGWYRLAGDSLTIGGYTYSDWHIHVSKYSTKYVVQEMYTLNGYKAVRRCQNGTWHEEWGNPPMSVGVEYRTTDRLFGAPVYKKAISLGGTSTTALSVAHGITGIDYPISCTLFNSSGAQTNNVTAIEFTKTNVNVALPSGGSGGKVVYAILEYTVSR